MKLPRYVSLLSEKIRYKFKDISLLEKAVTHSSYSNELRAHKIESECNERLEFLGDAVLQIVVSTYLYQSYADLPEGQLTKLRAGVVCEKALATYARKILLGDYLLLGRGEIANNGRNNSSMLADAFEALLGAVFLDAGGTQDAIKTVSSIVLPFVKEELCSIIESGDTGDYKSMLQQFIQKTENEPVEYVLVKMSGPDHCREFVMEARLSSNVIGCGSGRRKGIAEQNAARQALILFGQLPADK
ncbi:MAG: ribonuclease III [Clostridia bacterium]|nr:ribonuclease III [Clostridia bacterium]